jgi:hypothetical protein
MRRFGKTRTQAVQRRSATQPMKWRPASAPVDSRCGRRPGAYSAESCAETGTLCSLALARAWTDPGLRVRAQRLVGGQATLFWKSQSETEKDHIVQR